MHTYPLFSFFLLLFVMCFLSFSLSLSDRLRMAPKRKFTPARNPLGSRSSSFFDTPFLHFQFRDGKAQQDFLENFQRHGIHPMRHVILSNFFDIPLLGVIQTRGWESLCEIPLRCPIMFIHEFYSNMHSIDTPVPQFATTFRGTHIVVTSDLISKILHVPRVLHPDYLGYQCLRTVSKDELLSHDDATWCKVIIHAYCDQRQFALVHLSLCRSYCVFTSRVL